ncbi:MAG: hypothetical protein R3321_12805 [Nitrososphaeraceae archaeon]|nr:hypothetical protein [Nitrososphaeraceae archaeon]
MPNQYFVETADFDSFARYVCAFRENTLRVYAHGLGKKKVLSSRRVMSNSLFSIYTEIPNSGQYVSYNAKSGKEECKVVSSTKSFSKYAPIIHLKSLPSTFVINPKTLKDKFTPIQIEDLGSLARLTYDPEFPEESDIILFTFPQKGKWIIGHITSFSLENTLYFFNYVMLDKEPTKPFLQYSTNDDKTPIFTDQFQHGLSYLPVVKLKNSHPIFGIK